MRRKVGVSAVHGKKDQSAQFSKVGKQLEETKLSFVQDVMRNFSTTLAEFAAKHKERINSDPEFRQQFHKMCLSTGVDPLASSKGFWADILGVGDFYFELGVKIIQIAVQARSMNGGIMPIEEMLSKLRMKKHGGASISIEDIHRAVEKISVLGNGFRILSLGGKSVIISVPLEVTNDHEQLLSVAESEDGMVSAEVMQSLHGWTDERFALIIRPLLSDGMVWLDLHDGKASYYFPSLSNAGL